MFFSGCGTTTWMEYAGTSTAVGKGVEPPSSVEAETCREVATLDASILAMVLKAVRRQGVRGGRSDA
jgi:hypothetical protein